MNPNAANQAKTDGLIICNKWVSVLKHKKEPIRCLKCQGWNHIAAECVSNTDICGTCGMRGHQTSACTSENVTHCVSCDTDDHTSWSRDCPTFVRKCSEFNSKHPENDLPFYPSTESWTWATGPPPSAVPNRYRMDRPPPIQQTAPFQRLRQQPPCFGPQISDNPRPNPPAREVGSDQDPPGGTAQTRPFFPYPQLSNLDDFNSGMPPFNANSFNPTQ